MAFSPANVTYLSGYHNIDQHILPEIMNAVIYPLEGEPTFMLYVNYNPLVTFVKDVRRFPGYADRETAIMTLTDILHEKGLSGERVGIEKRYLSAHNWEVIQKEFPEVYWTDGTDVIERTRHIKTPAEVELLRAAVRSTDRAIFMAYTGARPTDTEKSVGDAMSHWAQRMGADIVSFNVIASGQRSDWGHFLGADVPLEPGSVMRCDFGAMYQGYFTDLARMAVVGQPSQRQRTPTRGSLRCRRRASRRPGPASRAKSCSTSRSSRTSSAGWATGAWWATAWALAIHERPIACPGEPWVVEEGMVMCIENGSLEERYNERYHIEDTVLITKDGYELLSDYTSTDEMIVIE